MRWCYPLIDDVELLSACKDNPVLVDYLKAWAKERAWSRSKLYRKLAKLRKYGWINQEGSVVWVSRSGMRVIKAWETTRGDEGDSTQL